MTEGRRQAITHTFPIQLSQNYNFPAQRIRQLIINSLTPLPVDPIPKFILISNIVITQVDENNLEISCEVFYEI